jgi:aspartate carbamoyltransferase catalytic subunit
MTIYEYERRLKRPTKLKLADFERNGRLKHVIFAQQLNRSLLDGIGRTAVMIRHLGRNLESARFLGGLLSHKRAMLYFTQSSTRTFLSFQAACQILGMNVSEIRDPRVSSEYKGESPIDSMRMFSSYSDLIVMRSGEPNFAERCAYLMNDLDRFNQRSVPIINGGSGADEHPTQALLDIFTIQRSFSFEDRRDTSTWTRLQELQRSYPDLATGLDGKTYTFCGDIGRGRTVRSLATLLAQYTEVTMQFVSPDHHLLRLQPDLRDRLMNRGVKVSEHARLSEIIDDTDLLYMTRVQSEHTAETEKAEIDRALSQSEYRLTPELVSRMKSYAPILHPFPRNDEIPVELDDDPRAMYFRQARNGVWVRAALIAHLFDVDGAIRLKYDDEMSDYHSYNHHVLKRS